MTKSIEVTLYNAYSTESRHMLIPVSAIITIKELTESSLLFVKDLKLYAETYYDAQQYKHSPEYLDIETIEVANTYNELKFLLKIGTVTTGVQNV